MLKYASCGVFIVCCIYVAITTSNSSRVTLGIFCVVSSVLPTLNIVYRFCETLVRGR